MAVLAGIPLFLFACRGATGPAGPKGDTGATGPAGTNGQSCTATDNGSGTKTITCGDGTTITLSDGQAGTSTGNLTGTVTSSLGGGAGSVTVTPDPLPDGVTAATTDGTGAYTLTVPTGVYTLHFTSSDYASKDVTGISVVAGGSANVDVTLDRTNPLVVTTDPVYLAGFGKTVTLGATVAGNSGTPTYSWTVVSGPTTVTLTGADTATPTFTTGSFDDIVTGGAIENLYREERAETMPITYDQMLQMSYVFQVTVTDGTFTTTATQTVQTMSRVGPWKNFPRGLIAVLNDVTNATYDWSLTTKPAGSNATLADATTRNPWFIPDVVGDYTVTDSATGNAVDLVAATWKGVNDNCESCHNGSLPQFPNLDQYDQWKDSGHAHHLENGLNGVLGTHYSMSCVPCHSVGFDPATDNGGFDDVMATDGWTFPKVLKPGNWTALPDNLKNLGNIQCENCHGPGSKHNGNINNITVSWDARNCAFCHDAPPHHDRFPLWSSSPHANRALALARATTEAEGPDAANCGRCHSAQGFAQYTEQLQSGFTGWLQMKDPNDPTKTVDADVAYLNSIGLNDANVQPQTCPACHDPHTLKLRLDGSSPVKLPGGFTATGLGKGTTCIACHNSRNGEHDDMALPTDYESPHHGAQGDVFLGKNAYFVDGYNVSLHSAIGDTCATCHVKIIPASVNTTGSNHTFVPDDTICASCHSPDVNGKGLQANVQVGLDDLNDLAVQAVTDQLTNMGNGNGYAVLAYDPTTRQTATVSQVVSQVPTKVTFTSLYGAPQGDMALEITVANPVSFSFSDGPHTLTTFRVGLWNLIDPTTTNAVYPPDSVLVESVWNIRLLQNDNTLGIHNPDFVLKVLTATQAKLRSLLAP